MAEGKHTPTPWRHNPRETNIDTDCANAGSIMAKADGAEWCIALVFADANAIGGEIAQANAALIVRAVNSHADLLAALEAMMDLPTENPVRLKPDQRRHMWAVHEQARAAIAKAKGGAA